jgi:hypothetical protein
MSYTLIQEREVKAARKAHRCIWCGQPINVGESYTYERSIFEGEPQTHHWHPECLGAMRALCAEEGGEVEFNAFYEERPKQDPTSPNP